MLRSPVVRTWVLLSVLVLASACRPSPPPAPRQLVTVTRPAGSWQGTGSQTIGFVSDSGRFRITWEARDERPSGDGTFRLTVNSAVSGRPIQVVADQHGDGRGSADVADDPRVYNLMVESAHVNWSFTVEELFLVDANAPASTSRNP